MSALPDNPQYKKTLFVPTYQPFNKTNFITTTSNIHHFYVFEKDREPLIFYYDIDRPYKQSLDDYIERLSFLEEKYQTDDKVKEKRQNVLDDYKNLLSSNKDIMTGFKEIREKYGFLFDKSMLENRNLEFNQNLGTKSIESKYNYSNNKLTYYHSFMLFSLTPFKTKDSNNKTVIIELPTTYLRKLHFHYDFNKSDGCSTISNIQEIFPNTEVIFCSNSKLDVKKYLESK